MRNNRSIEDSFGKHSATRFPSLRGVLLASQRGGSRGAFPVLTARTRTGSPAMAAAGLRAGRRISESMATGGLLEVSIRGERRHSLCATRPAQGGVVPVMGPMSANAGLIHLEARNTARTSRVVLAPFDHSVTRRSNSAGSAP